MQKTCFLKWSGEKHMLLFRNDKEWKLTLTANYRNFFPLLQELKFAL